MSESTQERNWTPWSGGDMPVAPDAFVQGRLWNQQVCTARAKNLCWARLGDPTDILAYRVWGQEETNE